VIKKSLDLRGFLQGNEVSYDGKDKQYHVGKEDMEHLSECFAFWKNKKRIGNVRFQEKQKQNKCNVAVFMKTNE